MKQIKTMTALAACVCLTMSLASCGGFGSSSSDSKFFGKVPGIYMEMVQKKDVFKEKFMACKSEDEARKVQAEAEEAEKEYIPPDVC